MIVDIKALVRNQRKLIDGFNTLNKIIASQAKAIEKLHERVKYLEGSTQQTMANDFMQTILKGKTK